MAIVTAVMAVSDMSALSGYGRYACGLNDPASLLYGIH
jgi:hypothetical protein